MKNTKEFKQGKKSKTHARAIIWASSRIAKIYELQTELEQNEEQINTFKVYVKEIIKLNKVFRKLVKNKD